MGMIRESFIIFKNWTDAINALPEEYQLESYKALVEYGTTGKVPEDISPITNAMLISFSVGMEKSICRYNASVENGKSGGRPKKEQSEVKEENLTKPNETYKNLNEPTANLNVNVNVNDNVNKNNNINTEDKITNLSLNTNKKNNKKESTLKGDDNPGDVLNEEQVINYIKDNIFDDAVCKRFLEYAANRKAMGKKYALRTKKAIDINIQHLRNWAKTTEEALAILDYSIANNYQGLFQPKEQQKKQTQKHNYKNRDHSLEDLNKYFDDLSKIEL